MIIAGVFIGSRSFREVFVIKFGSTITAIALFGLAGCTEARRERRSVTRSDRPADVTCRSFGQPFYAGRSTGKVTYDEGGRVTFVDRANGRLTTIEGECMIVYARASK